MDFNNDSQVQEDQITDFDALSERLHSLKPDQITLEIFCELI